MTRRYRINLEKLTGSAGARGCMGASPTGSTGATGSANATGRMGARDGLHGCAETGSAGAIQTVIETSGTTKESGKPAGAGVADPCPHQEIIAAYHRLLPMGRQVREWTPARASALRSRWREKSIRQTLVWWEKFFSYVARSSFLTGKAQSSDRRPFEVSLDWLIKSENMAKVIEGAYHDVQDADQGEPAHA